MGKPTDFPVAPALYPETQFYTQRLSDGIGEGNYQLSLEQLIDFLANNNIIISQGVYDGDDTAAAAGVSIGQWYEAANAHKEGLIAGTLIKRRV